MMKSAWEGGLSELVTIEVMTGIIGVVVGVVGVIVAIVGVIIARRANRDKERLEQSVRAQLHSLVNNIAFITETAAWGHQHVESVHRVALGMEQDEHVAKILEHAFLGKGDTLSSERMMKLLLQEARSIQASLFGTEETVRPAGDQKK